MFEYVISMFKKSGNKLVHVHVKMFFSVFRKMNQEVYLMCNNVLMKINEHVYMCYLCVVAIGKHR